mmetsp:Transcript_22525/g.51907  ORF Transcript_22525/g.51907 Transcript_22525/m.51907 type:complete len:263 (+) Transcript_22525:1596-2384(+)
MPCAIAICAATPLRVPSLPTRRASVQTRPATPESGRRAAPRPTPRGSPNPSPRRCSRRATIGPSARSLQGSTAACSSGMRCMSRCRTWRRQCPLPPCIKSDAKPWEAASQAAQLVACQSLRLSACQSARIACQFVLAACQLLALRAASPCPKVARPDRPAACTAASLARPRPAVCTAAWPAWQVACLPPAVLKLNPMAACPDTYAWLVACLAACLPSRICLATARRTLQTSRLKSYVARLGSLPPTSRLFKIRLATHKGHSK